MEQNNGKNQSTQSAIWRDPRLYQIASLSTLLLYGLIWLHFDISVIQIAVTLGAALLTQYAGTRFYDLSAFDPKSPLISALSLCLLLRTDHLAVAALASFVAIASKFVIRWKDKHVFNPTNLALVVMIGSGLGWISPGQWGQVAWFGFLVACFGSLVVTRAARADVTLAFLTFYIGLLLARAVWLGDPLTIPFHQIESGRENTEGLYAGAGGFLRKGTLQEVAIQESINTRMGVERCIRFAFDYCRRRNRRRKLTLCGKTNVLTYAFDLWERVFYSVAPEYPDIQTDYAHVDATCMWMVKNPEWFDVIVTDNMFGDIITDLGAMIQGGMGIAAGGNINPQGVSMFEPIGGSAPKYTGQNVINPLAAVAAVQMLLDHLREERAADKLEQAIKLVLARDIKNLAAGKMALSSASLSLWCLNSTRLRASTSHRIRPPTKIGAEAEKGR